MLSPILRRRTCVWFPNVSNFLQSKRSETVSALLPDLAIRYTQLLIYTYLYNYCVSFLGNYANMLRIGTVATLRAAAWAFWRVAVTGDGTGVGHSGPRGDVRTAGSGAGCEDLQGAVLEADWRWGTDPWTADIDGCRWTRSFPCYYGDCNIYYSYYYIQVLMIWTFEEGASVWTAKEKHSTPLLRKTLLDLRKQQRSWVADGTHIMTMTYQ